MNRTNTNVSKYDKYIIKSDLYPGAPRYFCKICNWDSSDRNVMINHVREHNVLHYVCHYPGCRFRTRLQTGLYDHQMEHSWQPPRGLPPTSTIVDQLRGQYKCRVCGLVLENETQARAHQRIHAGYRELLAMRDPQHVQRPLRPREYSETSSHSHHPIDSQTATAASTLASLRDSDVASTLASLRRDSNGVNQTGRGKKQYYGKRSQVMVKVPKNVKKWAAYAFKLKRVGFKGATETGWRRCRQLMTRDSIPIEDLRYMRNWYARHIYTSYPGFKSWMKAGRPKDQRWHNKHAILSWLTWGGSAGFNWVNSKRVVDMLNKHFNKSYKKIRGPKL